LAAPVTLNDAAVTVPATAGSVTPPVEVRDPAVVNTTVPAIVLIATFPKLMSAVLAIVIGVTIVAEELLVAETWAKRLVESPIRITVRAKNLICVFILFLVLIFFQVFEVK